MTSSEQETLPPGWEAIQSDKDQRLYYWNKKTGATTWKFPEQEAKQHLTKVRRHTYENVVKNPPQSKPTPLPPSVRSLLGQDEGPRSSPSSPKVGSQPFSPVRRGYENVEMAELHQARAAAMQYDEQPPQYEEIDRVGQKVESINPLYGRSSVSSAGSSLSEPLSPSPVQSDMLLSPAPDLPDRKYTPPPELLCSPSKEAGERGRSESIHQAPMHEVSALGSEYAIISPGHINRKHQHNEGGVVGAGFTPPTRPLRARERMTSRENLLRAGTTEAEGVAGTEVGVALLQLGEGSVVSDELPVQVPRQAYEQQPQASTAGQMAYSMVKLDPMIGKAGISEEDLPLPMSPQPYEVASPTPSSSTLHVYPSLHTTTPLYEEIERPAEPEAPGKVVQHSRTRPRGFSSPSTLEQVSPPPPDDSAFFSESAYDLPSNSRMLQALNVTLRRTTTPQSEYAKLSRSREALLLRSGVTLRRHTRESLSSMSSFASRLEGEEPAAGNSGPGTSDEEEDTLNKCIKGLESSLKKSEGSAGEDEFRLMIPEQPHSPSWVNFRRRPHAYEEIMGASQEQLDWDESDMGGALLGSCDMIKVEDSPSILHEPRVRVVHHQYEDVVLGEEGQALKESWVEGEGAGLPKGWQQMTDEQNKAYYWHIPTGKTQYSPPMTRPGSKKLSTGDGPSSSPPARSSPLAQTFPARYLGWMPISENQLVTGQCVKAVHACINKMAKTAQAKENKGEEVLLQVKGMELQWLKPGSLASITTQLINRIRVWGIGLENERDFGYVSRDAATRKHRCHIFRCSLPARAVAHVLLEAHQTQRNPGSSKERRVVSPVREVPGKTTPPVANGTAPRGGHEHYEHFSCVFVGSCAVSAGQGMEVLNEAVQRLSLSQRQWQEVCVDVAISNITITDKTGNVMKEHRVRYLSFLGIARDDRFCGYVVESGERKGEKCFTFFGFRMEPNTDRLCLALHSACQARYKRVCESTARQQQEADVPQGSKSSATYSLLGKFGSLKKSKKFSVAETKSFPVQYLGQQAVVKVDGLDTVRPVVQELAVNPKPSCPQEVEFDVSSAGLAIRDAQGRRPRREFPVKSITYVVKIRNCFAFVAKEKSKYFCHAFMESKVDTGTIVATIQNMLTPSK